MAHITPLRDGKSQKNADMMLVRNRPEPTIANEDTNGPSHAHTSMEQTLDKSLKASLAKLTSGLSPIALSAAYADWALHLASSPGKQLELVEKAGKKAMRLSKYAALCSTRPDASEPCIMPLPQDRRFQKEEWQKWPYNINVSVVPAQPAMVAQCHHRRRRRHSAA